MSGRLNGAEIARSEWPARPAAAADPPRGHRLRLCRSEHDVRPDRRKVWLYKGERLVPRIGREEDYRAQAARLGEIKEFPVSSIQFPVNW